jgi:predicted 3-demethylubiquinone-9 3-methyltransferase (glyoxalase superfamily)
LLQDGGKVQQCGWLTDKYGLSWQISHADLDKMIHDADPARVDRMMQAMFQMKKLDVPALKRAYEQK